PVADRYTGGTTMAQRLKRLAGLIAVMALVPAAGAADAETRPRSVLADIKALDQPVSYSETKIPLGELVEKIATGTGVRLAPAPGAPHTEHRTPNTDPRDLPGPGQQESGRGAPPE